MCHRISPLLIEELREAIGEMHRTGRARVPKRDPSIVVPDVYPGKQLPLFVPNEDGGLEPTSLIWGFENPGVTARKLVFNTRIETAIAQARSGHGLWADAIVSRRCIVPVRCFYESWTASPARRGAQVRFSYPGRQVFLLAGIYQEDRCSIVTTSPNESISPFHTRMPLVLAPGESSTWLGPNYACLKNRSHITLEAMPEA